MKKINNYSSRSSNTLTATLWENLAVAKQYFEKLLNETFNFEDRNGNIGFFVGMLKENRQGIESTRVKVFIQE